jgi:hypothetical protein
MLTINKQEAQKILVSELDYETHQAELFLEDYPVIHEELEEAVKKWFEDRTIMNFDVEGIAISEFMKIRNYNFLLAIKELNKLFDKDITEKEREKLKRLIIKPMPKW